LGCLATEGGQNHAVRRSEPRHIRRAFSVESELPNLWRDYAKNDAIEHLHDHAQARRTNAYSFSLWPWRPSDREAIRR
jgi:hypothetical protein